MNDIFEFITQLLHRIPEGLGLAWFWGLLPAYFLLYLLIGVIVMRYTGGAMTRGFRQLQHRSAAEILQQGFRQFLYASGIFTAVAILLPYFLLLNLKHDTLLTALFENMGTLISMTIGLTTIVLTVSVVIVLFHKNYYLVFSISDVLKSYHFTGCLSALLGSCLGACICAMVQLYVTQGSVWWKLVMLIMEACILICLLTCGISFRVICMVMFSNNKVELRLLRRLHRIFRGGERPDESQAGSAAGWDLAAVRTNVEYLCAEYVSSARMVPIHQVVRLSYLTGSFREQARNRLRSRAAAALIFTALGVWLISMVVIGVSMGPDGSWILLLNTIMLAAVTIPVFLGYRLGSDPAKTLFDDTLGYVLELNTAKRRWWKKSDGHSGSAGSVSAVPGASGCGAGAGSDPSAAADCSTGANPDSAAAADLSTGADPDSAAVRRTVRIPRITLRPSNRYDRFVENMNNLTAFFAIALDRGMSQEMTETAICLVIDWLADVKEKHSCLYLPVFAAGFYAFAHGQRIPAVQLCYAKVTGNPGKAEAPAEAIVSPVSGGKSVESAVNIPIPGIGPEKITGGRPDQFEAMLLGHLSDLTREIPPDGNEADTVLTDYMNWLHSTVTSA